MPLLRIHSSATTSTSATTALLKTLSADLAQELRKPEAYVMVTFTHESDMLFAGSAEPACFVALKNIGTFAPTDTERLSALLCRRLSESLGVAPGRIYIEFVEARGHLWGHDGSTFA